MVYNHRNIPLAVQMECDKVNDKVEQGESLFAQWSLPKEECNPLLCVRMDKRAYCRC